jgi:hypothetical protein
MSRSRKKVARDSCWTCMNHKKQSKHGFHLLMDIIKTLITQSLIIRMIM